MCSLSNGICALQKALYFVLLQGNSLSRSATMKNHFNYERPVCLYHGTVFKPPFEGTYIESPLKSQLRVRFKMEIQDNARMRTAYLTAAW